jgi:hypothetical protein
MGMEKPDSSVQIVSGAEASAVLDPINRRRIVGMLAESIHDDPPIRMMRLRAALRCALYRSLADQLVAAIHGNASRYLKHQLYPFWTDAEVRDSITHDFTVMSKEGTLSAALLNGQLAGVTGYAELPGKETDGLAVYEMRRGCILPDFREKGLFTPLAETVFARVQDADPRAHMIAATRHDGVARWCGKKGFQPMDGDRYWELKGLEFLRCERMSMRERSKRGEWQYLRRSPAETATDANGIPRPLAPKDKLTALS